MKKNSLLLATLAAMLISPALVADESQKKVEVKGDEAAKQEAVKPYKPTTCLISDEKLGEMGDAFVFVYQGQEIKLCCKKCKAKFDKDPAKYLKKLAETK